MSSSAKDGCCTLSCAAGSTSTGAPSAEAPSSEEGPSFVSCVPVPNRISGGRSGSGAVEPNMSSGTSGSKPFFKGWRRFFSLRESGGKACARSGVLMEASIGSSGSRIRFSRGGRGFSSRSCNRAAILGQNSSVRSTSINRITVTAAGAFPKKSRISPNDAPTTPPPTPLKPRE